MWREQSGLAGRPGLYRLMTLAPAIDQLEGAPLPSLKARSSRPGAIEQAQRRMAASCAREPTERPAPAAADGRRLHTRTH